MSPDWSVISVDRLFLPNTSPISSIGFEALMPVFTVTTTSIPDEQLETVRVAPTGKAMRVAVDNGEGALDVQVADNGSVDNALVVYSVPAGKVWPDFKTVLTGIGAMM